MEINGLTIDSAMKVHTALGAGLLEKPYQSCLKHELTKRGLKALSEVSMPVLYEGVQIDIGYRLDLLVEDLLIVEVKSVHTLAPIHSTQLHTYLRLSGKPLGLLLNFGARHMKDGIVRLINSPLRASARLC
jgi:GxxExxY protein